VVIFSLEFLFCAFIFMPRNWEASLSGAGRGGRARASQSWLALLLHLTGTPRPAPAKPSNGEAKLPEMVGWGRKRKRKRKRNGKQINCGGAARSPRPPRLGTRTIKGMYNGVDDCWLFDPYRQINIQFV
jgi:hypothetical protein